MRADVGLVDLLLVAKHLAPAADEATQGAVLGMLGWAKRYIPPARPLPSAPDPRRSEARLDLDREARVQAPRDEPRGEERPSAAAPRRGTLVTRLARDIASPPQPVPSPGSTPAGGVAPLVAPRVARGIATALAARPAPGPEVDTTPLLDVLVHRRPLQRLPMRTVWSLRHRMQLLVDCSPVLMPLTEDVQAIEGELARVIGNDRLERLVFDTCPLRGAGPGARSAWMPWNAPAPGTTLLLLTDLGCGGWRANPAAASAREWLAFARTARAGGLLPVALVPYPRERVPAALRSALVVVAWNERLAAGPIRRAVRDAARRRA